MPSPSEKVIAGHAVMAVGYDDLQSWFIMRNSWGSNWGMNGYFTLPYAYLLDSNLSSDFWIIRVVS
jgi:C1A family cysteine protease